MNWQAKLPAIPENSPLAWWMNFVEKTYPWVMENNPWACFVVGCSLIAQATKLVVNLSRPFPCNFFIALVGHPASGKGRILDCLNAVISGTWISDIPIGSAEGIEDAIEACRFGYILIDEMGELVDTQKKSDYLDKLKYVFNRIYYLDRIARVTRKKTTWIEANSYYVSVVLVGQEHDWKNLEKRWKRGTERRFLPVRVKGFKEPFRYPDPDPEAAEYLVKLQKWINSLRDYGVVLPKFEPSGYSQYLKNLDPRYVPLVEEYTMKILASVMVNNMFDFGDSEEVEVRSAGQQGHQGHPVSGLRLLTSIDPADLMLTFLTSDLDKNPEAFFATWSFIPLTLVNEVLGGGELADEKLEVIIARMRDYVKEAGEVVVSKKVFVREILKNARASEYNYYIKALEDGGYIRTFRRDRATYIILDPQASICANCKYFNKVCTLDYNPSRPEDRILARTWDPFQECKNDKFEPL
jgi:hypothetical protein